MRKLFRTIGAFIVATMPPIPLFLINEKLGALALAITWTFVAISTLPKNTENGEN